MGEGEPHGTQPSETAHTTVPTHDPVPKDHSLAKQGTASILADNLTAS